MNAMGHAGPHAARRWFWSLLLVALAAMGALSAALGAPPGPATGLAVLAASVVLLGAATQATRIWLVLDRSRRRPSLGTAPAAGRTPRKARGGRI